MLGDKPPVKHLTHADVGTWLRRPGEIIVEEIEVFGSSGDRVVRTREDGGSARWVEVMVRRNGTRELWDWSEHFGSGPHSGEEARAWLTGQ
jgi:hypothetical protein